MAESESKLNVKVDGKQAERELKKLRSEFDKLNRQVQRNQRQANKQSTAWTKLNKVAKTFAQTGGRLRSTLTTLRTTATGLTKVIFVLATAFGAWVLAVSKAGITTQKFINTLFVMTGSLAEARQEMNWLYETANRLGTVFTTAAVPFTKFAAAAQGMLSPEGIREVFTAFTEVGVALQLTASETTGIFLALQQIASKGVVSMEELRLQLAERVPGAMRLAASSMNMSMREFEEAVAQRTINASDFLVNFSRVLSSVYGDAARLASRTLYAGFNRLVNEFYRFRQIVFRSGFEGALKNLLQAITDFLNKNSQLAVWLGEFTGQVIQSTADAINSLTATNVVDTLNSIIAAFEELINTLREVAHWFRNMAGKFGFGPVDDMIKARDEYQKLIDVQNDMLAAQVKQFGFDASSDSIEQRNMERRIKRIQSYQAAVEAINKELQAPERISLGRIQPTPVGPGIPAGTEQRIVKPTGIEQSVREGSQRAIEDINKYLQALNKVETAEETLLRLNNEQFEVRSKMTEYVNTLMTGNETLSEQTRLQNLLIMLQEKDIALTEERKELLDKLRKEQEKLNKAQKEQKTIMDEIQASMMTVSDAVVNATTRMTDTIVDFAVHGKASFSDLMESIARDLVRLATQKAIIEPILGPLMAFLGQAGAGILNPGAGAGTSAGTTAAQQGWFGPWSYHSGGIVGGSGENTPIIARRGEGVFTKEQMANMAPTGTQNIKVEVDNRSSQPVRARAVETQVDVEDLVIRVITEDVRQGGSMSGTLENMYGLRRGR